MVVQVVALLFVISPAARAQFAVIDAAVLGAVNAVNGTVGAVNGSVTSGFQTANQWLSRIQGNTQQLQTLADRHSVEYAGGTYADSLASVTRRPTGMIAGRTITAGGRTDSSLSFAGADPTRRMRSIYPGAVPWSPGKYQDERARSANTALLTLRGGMRALHDFNRSIEDASRLTELGNAAGNANSYLAMDELQVRSQLEVARQIQALRAQQALQTNLYAVTESHRIGTEARQHAQDDQSGCQVLTKVMGGVPGAVLGALACTGGGTPPLP